MGPEVIALFVPIVSMLVIGGVIVAYYYFRHKSRTALQETLRQALDKGAAAALARNTSAAGLLST